MVGLRSQAGTDLVDFERRAAEWPLVRDCYMLNGEVDFLLRCVAPDLSSFQQFLTDELTAAPNVANVKTQLVVRTSKRAPGLPLDLMASDDSED
jgi:DNA-binding Lrp family transcriptional regulator